ncbi:MAG TPA: cytochrome c3 family protein [Planctomycetota bacterium]
MRHLIMLAAGTGALVAACSLVTPAVSFQAVPGRDAEFPHAIHLSVDVNLGCLDCHVDATAAAVATMPPFQLCMLCHANPGAERPGDGADELDELGGLDEFDQPAPGDEPDAQAEMDELDFLDDPGIFDEPTEAATDPVETPVAAADQEPAEEAAIPEVLAGFLGADGLPRWSAVTRARIELAFDHSVHARGGVDCSSCHTGLEESQAVGPGLAVPMTSCLSCHDSRAVADGGCLGCHAGVDESWQPPSHDGNWTLVHGAHSRMGASVAAQDCSLCHFEGGPTISCAECHLSVQPADHSLFFRNEGHGPMALFDRSRCQACHQEDTCLECHLSVMPRSHAPGFGEPRNQHCLGCHLGSGSRMRECSVCHLGGTPSHAAAGTPPPSVPAHATATSCMTCHATVKPPRHPFTGDGAYCRKCHR